MNHELIELAQKALPALERMLHPPKAKPVIKLPDGRTCIRSTCPWCGKNIHAWYGQSRNMLPKANNTEPEFFGIGI